MRTVTTKKSPSPTDTHVGARVRMRRLMLGMSQEKLGDALKLTFQQVQKYEKGSNRIGASRLQQIADALQVPVAFFFEGLNQDAGAAFAASNIIQQFFTLPYANELAQHYVAIADHQGRRVVANVAAAIAERGPIQHRAAAE